MNWIQLNSITQLEDIAKTSYERPQVIFKHSTRCSISMVANRRLNDADQPANTDFYFLDLLQYRDISNAIAEKFSVYHESPQVLLIHKGECIYDESHSSIFMRDIEEELSRITSV